MKAEHAAIEAHDAASQSRYRADVDQAGEWYVWRRLGANGWATMRRCNTRRDAIELAASLNAKSKRTG